MARVKVTINKKGNIPNLGVGPIRRPILITEELCNQLIKLGYPVKIITSPLKKITKKEKELSVVIVEPELVETKLENVEEETVEVQVEPAVKVIVEDSNEGESVIENEEKVITETEDTAEEILINDPDLSAEGYYTEDFLSSKKLCKKILSNRTIQYDESATWALLKKLVLDTNPEVDVTTEEA